VIGAVGFAAVGLAEPRVLGVGYEVIGDILQSRLTLGTVAVLAGAKLVAWWMALASGTSGGTLAPILLVSAGFGSLFGALAERLVPSLGVTPAACALVAMAAVFGAATRASFTGIVFVFELTGDYQAIVPLMIATVLADLVAAVLLEESLMTDKLARRGLRVSMEYEVDLLKTIAVGDIMTTDVETLPDTATVGLARDRMASGHHSAYPVVSQDGIPVAIVTRGDLLREGADDAVALLQHCARDLVTVSPHDLAVVALQLMLEESVEHVPVLEQSRLVGIVTRTDLLRVRSSRIAHERTEAGVLLQLAKRMTRRLSPDQPCR
jgi:CBS domain-containing protein